MSYKSILDGSLPTTPISAEPRALRKDEIDGLWELVVDINNRWRLFHMMEPDHEKPDARGMKSSWLEHVSLRAEPHSYPGYLRQLPSYIGEYENALNVISVLRDMDDTANALDPLLSVTTQPEQSPIWHARKYVVEEFMTVMVVAGGFREFGSKTYDGFLGGSRFNAVTEICRPIDSVSTGAGGAK